MSTNISDINGSYSGADIIANIIFPGCNPIAVGTASTITYSTYRETQAVRALSRINAKGFVKGPRTIAGTIIFTVLQKHIVNEIKKQVSYLTGIKKLKPDELPPFDILFTMGNEYGTKAHMAIYGVEIVDEGKVFSIEDMFTENTWSYLAHDIDLMDDIDSNLNTPLITLGEYEGTGSYDASTLVMDDDYVKMQEEIAQMKSDSDALIEQLRKESNEYISNIEGWVPGKDIIVVPPAGTETWEPADGDIDIDKESHDKFEIVYKKNHDKNSVPLEDIWIWCEFEIEGAALVTDVAKFKSAKVKVTATMTDKVCGTLKTDHDIDDKDYTVKFKRYQKHTPSTPTITIGVDKKEFTYSGTTYVLTGQQTITINNPANYTRNTPVKFSWSKKGSTSDTESKKDYVFKLDFKANSYTSVPGISTPPSGQLTQYAFRDATSNALKGDPPSAAVGNVYQPDFYTTATLTSNAMNLGYVTDVSKKIPNSKILGSFNMKATVTLDGKTATPTNHKKMKVKCDYKCTFNNKTNGTVVIDGKNSNNNVLINMQETFSPIIQALKEGGSFDLDSIIAGTTLFPTATWDNNAFRIIANTPNQTCISDQIVILSHVFNDCEDYDMYDSNPRKPFEKHSKQTSKNKCICGITHNKLTFELYNFRMYDPETKKEYANQGSVKSVYFRIINMTDDVLNALS